MRSLSSILAALVFVSSVSLSLADECSDVLAQQLGTRTNVQTQNGFDAASKHFRCLKNSQAQNSGSSTGIGARYGAFSGSYNQSNNSGSSTNSEDCGNESADQHESAFLYYSQVMYSESIQAWKSCMAQRESLACWPERGAGDRNVLINIRWGILSEPPKIRFSRLTVGQREVATRFTINSTLDLGENVMSVDRTPTDDVTFVIQAAPSGSGSKKCVVYVPPVDAIRPPEPTVHVGVWQNQFEGRPGIDGPRCNCVQFMPPPPPPPPLMGPPGTMPRLNAWPAGSRLRLFNRCPNTVQLVVLGETGQPQPPAGYPPPFVPFQGRQYVSYSLKAEHELNVDLSNKIIAGHFVDLCPTQNTMAPILPMPIPTGGAPSNPPPIMPFNPQPGR